MHRPAGRDFAAAHSTHPDPAAAIGEVTGEILEAGGQFADLAVLFLAGAYIPAVERIVEVVRSTLQPRALIGTTASSIIGNGTEVEGTPALSIWTGRTGPVMPVRLRATRGEDGIAIHGWPLEIPAGAPGVLLLADPFTFPVEAFIVEHQTKRPGLPMIGGLASAGNPGANRLILDGDVVREGAVAVVFGAQCEMETLVSQGCRPIGDPFVVTRADGRMILELGSRPALARFKEMAGRLAEADQHLLRQGVHIGQVIDEAKHEFTRGDFLVRNVFGADRERGAIAVGDEMRVGTTVQFHVRDAASAHEDLALMLDGRSGRGTVDGALVFTCNGRGAQFFGRPNHDAGMIHEAVASPVAGMFCAGEIGPIGGRNYLHGYTASVALFRRRQSGIRP